MLRGSQNRVGLVASLTQSALFLAKHHAQAWSFLQEELLVATPSAFA